MYSYTSVHVHGRWTSRSAFLAVFRFLQHFCTLSQARMAKVHIVELPSSLPSGFRLHKLMTVRRRALYSWSFAFYSVSAHFLSFLQCSVGTLSQTQKVKIYIIELKSNLPSDFRLYKLMIIDHSRTFVVVLCVCVCLRFYSVSAHCYKNKAKVHIFGLISRLS